MTSLHTINNPSTVELSFGSGVEETLAASNYLFNSANSARYAADVLQGVNLVATTVSRTTRPFTGATPAELSALVGAVDLDQPLEDTAAALAELESLYLKDAIYFHDTKYAAHLNCPVVIPALVGEAVLSAVNSSLDTWDQSAGATMIERRLIDWTTERIGLGPDSDGVFTSGGTQSNLQAMLIARNHAVARLRLDPANAGLRLPALLERLRIFTSGASHFSIRKSASMLGLGYDAVVDIECDARRRMDPAALARELAACHAEGLIPLAVVARPEPRILAASTPSVRWRPSAGPTAVGSMLMPLMAEGSLPRPGIGTSSRELAWLTPSRLTTTRRFFSLSAPAPCWSASAPPLATSLTTPITSTRKAPPMPTFPIRSTRASKPRAALMRSNFG